MADWTGIGLFLAIMFFFLYGLFRDKNPQSMNPRPFIEEERKNWREFQYNNFVVFVVALVSIFLLIAFIKWIWKRW